MTALLGQAEDATEADSFLLWKKLKDAYCSKWLPTVSQTNRVEVWLVKGSIFIYRATEGCRGVKGGDD